jgi:hypothetical protein
MTAWPCRRQWLMPVRCCWSNSAIEPFTWCQSARRRTRTALTRWWRGVCSSGSCDEPCSWAGCWCGVGALARTALVGVRRVDLALATGEPSPTGVGIAGPPILGDGEPGALVAVVGHDACSGGLQGVDEAVLASCAQCRAGRRVALPTPRSLGRPGRRGPARSFRAACASRSSRAGLGPSPCRSGRSGGACRRGSRTSCPLHVRAWESIPVRVPTGVTAERSGRVAVRGK